ncbi:MAG: ABC transporter ATP-binding protein [Syntrophaceae bacterium]
MSAQIVCMEQVDKIYVNGEEKTYALQNMNLTLNQGEFTALCGPSGSGKTTALNLIGILDSPSKGRIVVEGKDLGTLTRSAQAAMRKQRIGFIFQAYNLIPVLSVYENAEFVLMLKGVPMPERRAKVMAILDIVGMADKADRRPHQISGGQQQRVAIARAVAGEPALVLADEPTANVDSKTADGLLDLMERLNTQRGVTFLFSTHDPRVMERARRIVTLKDGTVTNDSVKQ